MTPADRLFSLMEKRGITQKQLSEGIGISPRTISDWKTKGASPRADKIDRICGFLGVSAEWLLFGEERYATNSVSNVCGSAFFQGVNNGTVIVRSDGEHLLSDEEAELLHIYMALDVRSRHRIMGLALSLDAEAKANEEETCKKAASEDAENGDFNNGN
jgi:transcriptional regulator with XRE-family HTH domain